MIPCLYGTYADSEEKNNVLWCKNEPFGLIIDNPAIFNGIF